MNSLYNLALRQSSSIQSDLTLIESSPNGSPSFTSLSGQLSASLSAFSRTVDDYENMAKRELHIQKREKALQRVKKFREEERDMRAAFSIIKNKVGTFFYTCIGTLVSLICGAYVLFPLARLWNLHLRLAQRVHLLQMQGQATAT